MAVSSTLNIMYIQPFTTVVDWPGIVCLIKISTMFYAVIFADTAFLRWTADNKKRLT